MRGFDGMTGNLAFSPLCTVCSLVFTCSYACFVASVFFSFVHRLLASFTCSHACHVLSVPQLSMHSLLVSFWCSLSNLSLAFIVDYSICNTRTRFMANYALLFSWLERHVGKMYTLSALDVQFWAYLTRRHDREIGNSRNWTPSSHRTRSKMATTCTNNAHARYPQSKMAHTSRIPYNGGSAVALQRSIFRE